MLFLRLDRFKLWIISCKSLCLKICALQHFLWIKLYLTETLWLYSRQLWGNKDSRCQCGTLLSIFKSFFLPHSRSLFLSLTHTHTRTNAQTHYLSLSLSLSLFDPAVYSAGSLMRSCCLWVFQLDKNHENREKKTEKI